MPFHDGQHYARLLLPRLHGYPLWRPEPSTFLPQEYRSEGVRIGDVGVLTPDGGFDFLFNICLSMQHPINHRGVPQGFEPLEMNLLERDGCDPFFNPYTDIASRSISRAQTLGGGLEFQSLSSDGAILALPNGASRVDLRTKQPFLAKAHQDASKWYHFARVTRGRTISDHALYLVTGCDKCRSWGVASFSNRPPDHLDLKLQPTMTGDSLSYNWSNPGHVSARAGPASSTSEPNQCVFLRGYRISVRSRLNNVPQRPDTDAALFGDDKNLKLEQNSFGSPFTGMLPREDCSVDEFSQAPEPYHPLTAINTFLLNTTGCTTAITHDDAWISSLHSSRSELLLGIPDDNDLLSRVMAFHKVFVLGETVSLQPQEMPATNHHHEYIPQQNLYPSHPVLPPSLSPPQPILPPLSPPLNTPRTNNKQNLATTSCLPCASRKVQCPPLKGLDHDCVNCQRLQISCKWTNDVATATNTSSRREAEAVSRDLRVSRRSLAKSEKAILDSPYKSSLNSRGKGSARSAGNGGGGVGGGGGSGCFTCRIRKKKCDGGSQRVDGKNSCATCARLHVECLALGGDRPDWLKDKDKVDDVRLRIKEFLSSQGKIIGQASGSEGGDGRNSPSNFLYLSEGDDIAPAPRQHQRDRQREREREREREPSPPISTPQLTPTPTPPLPSRDEQLEIWDPYYNKPFDTYGGVYEDPLQPHYDLQLPPISQPQPEPFYYWS